MLKFLPQLRGISKGSKGIQAQFTASKGSQGHRHRSIELEKEWLAADLRSKKHPK
jgi:hypothetical protein